MARKRLYGIEPHYQRQLLREATNLSAELHSLEEKFTRILEDIDKDRIFVRYGYRSLRTYLIRDLNFTRIQAQRIVTLVRREQTTFDIGQKGYAQTDRHRTDLVERIPPPLPYKGLFFPDESS